MDQKDKTSIASVLVREPDEARKRLVLGLAIPSGGAVSVRPASFKDRTEYRKALVEHQRRAQQTYVDEVASKLCDLGLAVRAFPLANSIVVGGDRTLTIQDHRDPVHRYRQLFRQGVGRQSDLINSCAARLRPRRRSATTGAASMPSVRPGAAA